MMPVRILYFRMSKDRTFVNIALSDWLFLSRNDFIGAMAPTILISCIVLHENEHDKGVHLQMPIHNRRKNSMSIRR